MAAICLGDVFHRSLRVLLGNRCFTKVVTAAGTTATTIKTTADAQYCIDGIMYLKATTDDLFVFSDVSVQSAQTTRFYALCLDASGTATVVNGEEQLTAAVTAGTVDVTFPEVADTVCVVGGLKVTTAAGTFTPATTNVATGGAVTVEFFNFSCVPTAAAA